MLKSLVTIFWLCWAGAVNAQTPGLQSIDRAVALVDNAVVTASDLKLHVAISAIDKSFVPILNPNPDRILDDVINAAVVQNIAGRISTYQPNPAQVRARLNDYRSRWLDAKDWEAHLMVLGLTEKSITRAFERRLIIERVVARAVGTPEPEQKEDWSKAFTEWINRERRTVRVRLVEPQANMDRP